MNMPPEYLEPLLKDIETTVLELYNEFPRLADKDIESVYDKLLKYFKLCSRGLEVEEPFVPSERAQALLEEILNTIDNREEEDLDTHIVNNPDMRLGEHTIPSLNHLYIIALKRLHKSARMWRKEHGVRGYIQFISRFIKN